VETYFMGRSFWTRRNPATGIDEVANSASGPWRVQTDAEINRIVDEVFGS